MVLPGDTSRLLEWLTRRLNRQPECTLEASARNEISLADWEHVDPQRRAHVNEPGEVIAGGEEASKVWVYPQRVGAAVAEKHIRLGVVAQPRHPHAPIKATVIGGLSPESGHFVGARLAAGELLRLDAQLTKSETMEAGQSQIPCDDKPTHHRGCVFLEGHEATFDGDVVEDGFGDSRILGLRGVQGGDFGASLVNHEGKSAWAANTGVELRALVAIVMHPKELGREI